MFAMFVSRNAHASTFVRGFHVYLTQGRHRKCIRQKYVITQTHVPFLLTRECEAMNELSWLPWVEKMPYF